MLFYLHKNFEKAPKEVNTPSWMLDNYASQ